MEHEDLSVILPDHTVYPFPEIVSFDENGHIIMSYSDEKPFTRVAIVECPFCLAIGDFYELETPMFAKFFCSGNQPAERECKSLFGGTHTHPVECAGILQPHMHVKCSCCQEEFFLSKPVIKREEEENG